MKVHLLGIGGAAMGNLAAMLRGVGHKVSGSDAALYPPMSEKLKEWKIPASEFRPANIGRADLYVVGNAISRGNPELEELLNRGAPYMSMPRALSEFFLNGKDTIVVAGTHGKTTTTFLIDHLLSGIGQPPGLFAGGVRADGMDGFRISDSPFFVIEGDEYDTAFFDKASKFMHYRPYRLALTSVEFDHADIFKNREAYELAFRRLLRTVPGKGLVAACRDDAGARRVLENHSFSRLQWYGKSDFRREGRRVCLFPGEPDELDVEEFSLLGDHNTANALAAALVVLDCARFPERNAREKRIGAAILDAVRAGLRDFPGVRRRQQIRRDVTTAGGSPLVVMEDFAHHPTAVRETLAAVKQAYPGHRLHAFFEPRSATSHRNVFQKRYPSAFSAADDVYICDVFNPEKVAKNERLDVRQILREIPIPKKSKKAGRREYGANPTELFEKFRRSFAPASRGDVILLMSNGAFGGIYEKMDAYADELATGSR